VDALNAVSWQLAAALRRTSWTGDVEADWGAGAVGRRRDGRLWESGNLGIWGAGAQGRRGAGVRLGVTLIVGCMLHASRRIGGMGSCSGHRARRALLPAAPAAVSTVPAVPAVPAGMCSVQPRTAPPAASAKSAGLGGGSRDASTWRAKANVRAAATLTPHHPPSALRPPPRPTPNALACRRPAFCFRCASCAVLPPWRFPRRASAGHALIDRRPDHQLLRPAATQQRSVTAPASFASLACAPLVFVLLFAPLARPPRCLATALATHKHAHGIATPAASTTSLAPQHQQTRVYRQRRRRRWAAA